VRQITPEPSTANHLLVARIDQMRCHEVAARAHAQPQAQRDAGAAVAVNVHDELADSVPRISRGGRSRVR